MMSAFESEKFSLGIQRNVNWMSYSIIRTDCIRLNSSRFSPDSSPRLILNSAVNRPNCLDTQNSEFSSSKSAVHSSHEWQNCLTAIDLSLYCAFRDFEWTKRSESARNSRQHSKRHSWQFETKFEPKIQPKTAFDWRHLAIYQRLKSLKFKRPLIEEQIKSDACHISCGSFGMWFLYLFMILNQDSWCNVGLPLRQIRRYSKRVFFNLKTWKRFVCTARHTLPLVLFNGVFESSSGLRHFMFYNFIAPSVFGNRISVYTSSFTILSSQCELPNFQIRHLKIRQFEDAD